MIRTKPLAGLRRKRRAGNRAMTKAEGMRVVASKCRCMPCLVWARAGNMPMEDVAVECDYDHSKSGNIRRGHGKGFGSCLWHHKRQIEADGWTHAQMRAHFGPSLMDGSRLFRDAYGSDDELIALQTAELEAA